MHNRSTSLQSKLRVCRLGFVILVALAMTSLPAFAANHYVSASGSGSATGADWSNACKDFTGSCAISSLVRGDTYYVAAGSYSSHAWNKAASGSLVITIKRATQADHGTATGWTSTMDGQVKWAYSQDFSTGFWVFDGMTAPASAATSSAADPTQYGFTIPHSTSCGSNGNYPVTITASNVTVAHTSITNGCGSNFNFTQYSFVLGWGGTACNNTVLSHIYSEFTSTDVQILGSTCNNIIIEYLHSKGQWSTDLNHGEVMALGGDNTTLRYSYFEQCTGTGCFASGGPQITNAKIYGNVMNNVSNNAPGTTGCGGGGNGAIVGAGQNGVFSGFQIYNNTIIQPGMCFGWFYTNGGSGNNIVKNNIIWGACGTNVGGSSNVFDSNVYMSCWQGSGTETNKQTLTTDPFVASKFNAPGVGDYHLKTDTSAWAALASPYNIDMDGVTRQTSRGAYQFGSVTQIAPPTGVTAVPH
jgi:hypothetical protein